MKKLIALLFLPLDAGKTFSRPERPADVEEEGLKEQKGLLDTCPITFEERVAPY